MVEQSPDGSEERSGRQLGLTVMADEATAEDDDGDLTDSLLALTTLSAARLSLEDLLTRVATFAVHAIPGACRLPRSMHCSPRRRRPLAAGRSAATS